MNRSAFVPAVAAGVLLTAIPADSQVLKDLDPIRLEYDIALGAENTPIGKAWFFFEPVETKRGPRLRVTHEIEYTIMRGSPFHYREEGELMCDEEGIEKFETLAEAGGSIRKNTALRIGEDFQLTTDFDGSNHTKSITAGVQRTNIGLFCAGFLKESIMEGPLMQDFPLLYPVGGDHQARQKFREGRMAVTLEGGRRSRVVINMLKRPDQKNDRTWHIANDHGILVRLEEETYYGRMTYRLTTVDGIPASESDATITEPSRGAKR